MSEQGEHYGNLRAEFDALSDPSKTVVLVLYYSSKEEGLHIDRIIDISGLLNAESLLPPLANQGIVIQGRAEGDYPESHFVQDANGRSWNLTPSWRYFIQTTFGEEELHY